MFNWNQVDLSPEFIYATFVNGGDNTISRVLDRERNYCCDNEILEHKIEYGVDYLLDKDWYRIKTHQSLCLMYQVYTHGYGPILITMRGEYAEGDSIEAIILIEEDHFIVVGVIGSHPFLETPDIVYSNSDGSGPNMFYEDDKGKDVARKLVKYYKAFMENKYH